MKTAIYSLARELSLGIRKSGAKSSKNLMKKKRRKEENIQFKPITPCRMLYFSFFVSINIPEKQISLFLEESPRAAVA